MQQENNKILLHACCGICSGHPIEYLKGLGYEVVVYFCNPNLDTEEEYIKRLAAQKTVCENFSAELIAEPYDHKTFLNSVKGYENEPERGARCDICLELRLQLAAKKANELGINVFTTSLVISPHKDFEKISKIGEKLAEEYGLEYLAENFRKKDGFLKTNNISKELGIYRQNYCGCEFAKR